MNVKGGEGLGGGGGFGLVGDGVAIGFYVRSNVEPLVLRWWRRGGRRPSYNRFPHGRRHRDTPWTGLGPRSFRKSDNSNCQKTVRTSCPTLRGGRTLAPERLLRRLGPKPMKARGPMS